jgi:hypothetical protein
MKVDITYDALLRPLIEAIRNERDPGKALMGVLSRLLDEAGQEGRLASGAGQMRKKRATARRAKPAGTAKAISRKARLAAKSAAARKANGSTQATKKRATAKRAKPAATPKSANARPMTKSAPARKVNGSAQATKKRMTARLTKPAKLAAKAASARKPASSGQARRKPVTAPPAKPAPVSGQAHGLGQTSRDPKAPASAT